MTSQNLIDTILKTLLDSKNLLKKSQLNVNKVVECFSECKSYLNNSSKARKVKALRNKFNFDHLLYYFHICKKIICKLNSRSLSDNISKI